MIRTPLCDVLGIQVPVIKAGMGPFGSGAELAAAASNAGALGTIGAGNRPPDDLERQIARFRELSDRPFAINQVHHQLTDESVEAILAAKPRVFSFALGDPGDLVQRASDAGILFIQQVHTVEQAEQVAERGVDVIVAQGTEAGGFTGGVSAMPLIPQVVDAVTPIPVVAAGGIADGRGFAAALALGAQGIQLGTRFLASTEATISEEWKQAIVDAHSEDAVKAEFWLNVFPLRREGGFPVVPRSLRTAFIEEWLEQRDKAGAEAERLSAEIGQAVREGRMLEKVPFTGQTAGLIKEALPVAEILDRLVAEAEAALSAAAKFVS
jgi:nitronate monooxygenase/enoyl-[acyl-carrier protein] reductase II